MSAYHINVSIHIFAALIWLGGMFFFALVGAPTLRTIESAELRARLFTMLGERFRTVGWVCIVILLITGFLNLQFRGLLSAQLFEGAFWATSYGKALAAKLLAVLTMLVVQATHDFYHGPAASRTQPGSADALRMRKQAAIMARVSVLLGVLVVLTAVKLARP